MIFVKDKIYGKVWKITKSEKYLDLQMTTSEKDQEGNYINSGWFPRCIGHAFNSLKDTLKEGDRICITKSKLTNERYTAQDGTTKSAFRFLILEASIELPNGEQKQAETPATPTTEVATEERKEEECPW